MRLGTEDIFVGDVVYDLGYGSGTVVEVNQTIRVHFTSLNQTWTYSSQGIRRGAKLRQLYFHNPILCVPSKEQPIYDIVKATAKYLSEKLGER